MRRVLATLAYWAVGLIVYPVRIGADWVERHGQPDDPIDPTWERHQGLIRAWHPSMVIRSIEGAPSTPEQVARLSPAVSNPPKEES